MYKLLHIVDLTRMYERYNYLVTQEGRKQFVRAAYTIGLCAIAVIFIWYNCFISLNAQLQQEVSPAKISLDEQSQSNKSQPLGDIKNTYDIKSTEKVALKTGNDEKSSDNNLIDKQPASKTSGPAITVKKQEAKIVKKDYGVVKKTIYKGANTSQVAITFDDGYNQKTVEKVLDVLKKNNVKSTFFIIGKVLDDYPEVWKRAIDEGHQICNHTNNHQLLTNMSDSLVEAEIKGWETSARKVFGADYVNRMKKEFPYLRLPGGGGAKSNRILSIAQKNGYTVVGWNLETFSSIINPLKKTHSVKDISIRIEKHVVSKCSNGSIILLHFNQYDSGNIDGIIKGIKKRGFNMQLLSEIIK